MPFLNLDKNWSNLAQYYNQNFNNKPEIPAIRYTSFDDGLIRGGIVNATLASVRDTARVGKFIASGKGVSFITKQIILQATNPKLEASGSSALSNRRTPNQIYNLGLNTLTQIPLTAFGGHVIRQGTLPVFGGGNLEGSDDNIKGYNYVAIAKANNAASKQSINQVISTASSTFTSTNTSSPSGVGQLDNLYVVDNSNADPKDLSKFIPPTDGRVLLYASPQDLINKKISPLANKSNLGGIEILSSKPITSLSYQNAPNRLLTYLKLINTDYSSGAPKITSYVGGAITLQDYNGGPGSTYGVGKTIIKTYPDQRTNAAVIKEDPKKELLNGFNPKSYARIDQISTDLSSKRSNQTYISPNKKDNVEDRIGVSKIGKITNPVRSVDAINTINIIPWDTFVTYSSGSTPNAINANTSLFSYTKDTNGKAVDGYFGRDIIKFRIEFLNNNNNQNDVLAFRAYIDDFQDGMQAKWNPYCYMGRGEEFYVYDGFTRDVSVAFTIYAHSPEEMRPLYKKLNFLMSTFAPDYNSLNKMRGNIAYLTVGDYLYRQPGVFTDIKLSGMLDTHWEIALNEPEGGSDSNQYEVPKHIKVSLSFKPIHDFLPRKAKVDALENTPFITRNKQYGANKYFYQENKSFKPLTKGEHESLSESERQARSL